MKVMRDNFQLYDKNNDGIISLKDNEFRQLLSGLGITRVNEAGINAALKVIDKDSNQMVDWQEFIDLCGQLKLQGSKFVMSAIEDEAANSKIDVMPEPEMEQEIVNLIANFLNKAFKDDEELK